MVKLSDLFIQKIKSVYLKKGIVWNRSDSLIWGFWAKVFPVLALIPLLFWLLKKLLIDYMLVKYGFERTIIYITILVFIRPILMSLITAFFGLKNGGEGNV